MNGVQKVGGGLRESLERRFFAIARSNGNVDHTFGDWQFQILTSYACVYIWEQATVKSRM